MFSTWPVRKWALPVKCIYMRVAHVSHVFPLHACHMCAVVKLPVSCTVSLVMCVIQACLRVFTGAGRPRRQGDQGVQRT